MKCLLIKCPGNPTPCYLTKRKTYSHKNLCQRSTAVLFIIVEKWNPPNYLPTRGWIRSCGPSMQWKTTQQWEGANCWHMQHLSGSQRHYAVWKKPVSKCCILQDSIDKIVSKRQNCHERKPFSVCQELGVKKGYLTLRSDSTVLKWSNCFTFRLSPWLHKSRYNWISLNRTLKMSVLLSVNLNIK